MNVETVITALGGIPRAAKVCDITESAIHKWRVHGGVPSKHWTVIVEKTGITFEALSRIGTGRKRRAA